MADLSLEPFSEYPDQAAFKGLGARKLQQMANDNTLRRLAAAVNGQAAAATFACGGSIQLSSCLRTDDSIDDGIVPCLQLQWDTRGGAGGKVRFPLTSEDQVRLEELVDACQPASFGLGGKEVLDQSYRKAGKLDRSEFLTDFHPHDCGIIDSIRQILLPSMVKGGEGIGIGTRGVRAELYKLNVYSGPSGMFNAHVGTPRGAKNFGSLVVCLPCSHEGGTLRIWHKGRPVEFDWSNGEEDQLQWAAFYGDCEHQVMEVTRGHRITLTYNLYYSEVGNLAQPVADPKQLALYSMVQEMYETPGFMSKGAVLGFFCNHQYAHSQSSGRLSLPGSLKGVDLAVFAAFKALDLKVLVKPVMEKDGWNGHPWGGLRVRAVGVEDKPPEEPKSDPNGRRKRAPEFDGEYGTVYSGDDSDQEDYDDYDEYYDYEESVSKGSVVGTGLHGVVLGGGGGLEDMDIDDDYGEFAPKRWRHKVIHDIHWLNDPIHEDFAEAHMAYGNEPSLSWSFSAAAIIVTIPSISRRHLPSTSPDANASPEVVKP